MEEDRDTSSTEPPKTEQLEQPEAEEVGGDDHEKDSKLDEAVDVVSVNPEEVGGEDEKMDGDIEVDVVTVSPEEVGGGDEKIDDDIVVDVVTVSPEEVGGGDEKIDDDVTVDVVSVNPEEKRGERPKKKRKRPLTSAKTSGKKKRGRPPGSGKYQKTLASLSGELAETAGGDFTPYIVTVNSGENVVDYILDFSRRSGNAVTILSANGSVSSVLIRTPGSSSDRGASKFEGHFHIACLSGLYTFFGGRHVKRRHKMGNLTVLLVRTNGRTFGGAVGSSLIADGPIQLVLASFKQDIKRETMKRESRKSARSSAAAATPTPSNSSSDSEMVPLELEEPPSLIEGQPSCPSPTSGLLPTTTGVSDTINIPATTTVGSDIVNIPANQNMSSASVNTSVGMTLQPIPAQRDPEDDDASVKISKGQP